MRQFVFTSSPRRLYYSPSLRLECGRVCRSRAFLPLLRSPIPSLYTLQQSFGGQLYFVLRCTRTHPCFWKPPSCTFTGTVYRIPLYLNCMFGVVFLLFPFVPSFGDTTHTYPVGLDSPNHITSDTHTYRPVESPTDIIDWHSRKYDLCLS